MSEKVTDIFGIDVFNETVMLERLPKKTFAALKKTIENGEELDAQVAEVVANAMKDWAIEKGATHYSHWFQPMTGITAEKHDAFITPIAGGKVVIGNYTILVANIEAHIHVLQRNHLKRS